jgi:hypothetical protein
LERVAGARFIVILLDHIPASHLATRLERCDRLPDVREGEQFIIILPELNSPPDSSGSTPVTLRDGPARIESAIPEQDKRCGVKVQ